ncbi:hypothetical protein [Streptacidiphilus sp. EB103A]|uniref:hypothetical protein n=1 Tax=Streptacidiphilus sp. EB103A TaxID=3156275 RepID=UPI0035128C28
MSDRRFPEQHEDLQDRARWDEESPERPGSPEPGDTDLKADEDANAEQPEVAKPDLEKPELAKPHAETTVAHPDVDAARTELPLPAPAAAPVVSPAPTAPTAAPAGTVGRLFPEGAGEKLRDRWQHIQIDFVDDPRHAVEEADALVDQVAARLTESITANHRALRDSWDKQGAGSAADDSGFPTEQLRLTLQQYRSMLNRLLDA